MGAGAGGKKQREVYVGNLTIGSVNDVMLKELFNGALAHLMPDAATNPPVVNVAMDPSGAYLSAGHVSRFVCRKVPAARCRHGSGDGCLHRFQCRPPPLLLLARPSTLHHVYSTLAADL